MEELINIILLISLISMLFLIIIVTINYQRQWKLIEKLYKRGNKK